MLNKVRIFVQGYMQWDVEVDLQEFKVTSYLHIVNLLV
jgi:hypothetical protein